MFTKRLFKDQPGLTKLMKHLSIHENVHYCYKIDDYAPTTVLTLPENLSFHCSYEYAQPVIELINHSLMILDIYFHSIHRSIGHQKMATPKPKSSF